MQCKTFRDRVIGLCQNSEMKNTLISHITTKQDTTNPYNALEYSARYGYIDILNLLLDIGYDVNKCNDSGHTALHVSCSSGKQNIVKRIWKAFWGGFGKRLGSCLSIYPAPRDEPQKSLTIWAQILYPIGRLNWFCRLEFKAYLLKSAGV